MIAVSTVDRVGGIILVASFAVSLIGVGVIDLVRAYVCRPPRSDAGTAGLPCSPARRTVEAGNFSAADVPYREDETTRQSQASAAESIEALTFPGPYSRIGNRR